MRLLDRLHAHRERLTQQQADKPKGSLMLWIMLLGLVINFLRCRQGK